MRLLLLALLVSGVSAGAAGAQSRARSFVRPQRPLGHVYLDLASGTLARTPLVAPRAASTVSDFTNLDVAGFAGIDSGGGLCEWIEAGTKGIAGNRSDLMASVVVSYCSAMLDPSLGGPGGSLQIGFYEGYTQGGSTPGTLVAAFALTGLPANSASGSMMGVGRAFECYFLELTLAAPVSFADGPIGYSWRFVDVGSDGAYAGTAPMLACVQSCSGAGPDGQGLEAGIDQYCPPGTFACCNWDSCAPAYWEALALEVREVADRRATANAFTGDGVNADVLLCQPIVVGTTWISQVQVGHAHGSAGGVVLRVRAAAVNGPTFASPIGGRLTELLVSGPLLASLPSSHDGSLTPPIALAVPVELGLIDVGWAAQAVVLGGGFADLSTAVVGISGTE